MTHLAPGDLAPDFALETDAGTTFRLSAQRGRPVVLYFYPADDTEGRTIENVEFSQRAGAFAALRVAVLGISPTVSKSTASSGTSTGSRCRLPPIPGTSPSHLRRGDPRSSTAASTTGCTARRS